ncbi:MAG: Jag N-terminal domain-containing protein [Lachnospiraceae bacterium]|jgi:spoIIIJ-associated protein|nr:Jag N-terminal domain-containing protein [Lachnospiraceae bacterium]
MSKTIVVEGRTTNEAIENGLKELKVGKNQVNIKVLEEEHKSFFSILDKRVVKVEMTLKESAPAGGAESRRVSEKKHNQNMNEIEEAKEKIETFINAFVKTQNLTDVETEVFVKEYGIYVNINGNSANYLTGYRGEILNSLQIILSSIINSKYSEKISLYLNINNYREKRIATLESLADKLSKTVLKTRKSITLEPMSAFERKIIHARLQGNEKITTYSKGEEPYRKIVIEIKKQGM